MFSLGVFVCFAFYFNAPHPNLAFIFYSHNIIYTKNRFKNVMREPYALFYNVMHVIMDELCFRIIMCTSVLYIGRALWDALMHSLSLSLSRFLFVSRIRCFCHPAARAARALIVRVIIHRGASLMHAHQRGAFCSNFTSFQTPLTSALAGFSSMQFGFARRQVKPL